MNSLHSAPSLLDIPELVLALTGHLTRYDLTVCIRVNRAWFAAFIPRLWENVHVKDFDYFRQPKSRNSRRRHEHPVGSEPEPTLSVRKYGHLIRSLSVRSELALRQLGPSLTSLRLLDLTTLVNCGRCFEDDRMRPERQTLREGHDGRGSIAILCSIFGQNVATLTTVRLSLLNHGDTIVLIDALRQISSLEELTIFDSALFVRREHYLATLVEVCRPTTNLKRLAYCRGRDSGDNHGFPAVSSTRRNQEQDTLTRTSIDDDGTGLGKRSSRGIQQLRLTIPHGTGRDDLVRIFQSCGRELQSLSFGSFPREKIVFLRDILQDSCPNLRYLSFRTSVANPLDRELWMDLLNNCPPLEVLVIYNGIHARSLVDVLKRRHAESLLEIHLYRQECEYEQSDLLEILEFCPRLQEFMCRWFVSTVRLLRYTPLSLSPSAPALYNSTMVRWACASTLRRLTLCPAVPLDHQENIQMRVLRYIFHNAEKLSQLVLLNGPFSVRRELEVLTRISWDESDLWKWHQAMGSSTKLACSQDKHRLVANFY